MKLHHRIVWLGSYLAPFMWLAAMLVFGLFVIWPKLRGVAVAPRAVAWLIGMLAVGLAAHLLLLAHSVFSSHFTRDQKAELRFRLIRGGGHGKWRQLMRPHRESWYHGRSSSGARPHFD